MELLAVAIVAAGIDTLLAPVLCNSIQDIGLGGARAAVVVVLVSIWSSIVYVASLIYIVARLAPTRIPWRSIVAPVLVFYAIIGASWAVYAYSAVTSPFSLITRSTTLSKLYTILYITALIASTTLAIKIITRVRRLKTLLPLTLLALGLAGLARILVEYLLNLAGLSNVVYICRLTSTSKALLAISTGSFAGSLAYTLSYIATIDTVSRSKITRAA